MAGIGIQQVMRALAEETRREILELLKQGPMSASRIAEHFSISAPAISRHLNILKDAGLVRCRRQGNFLIYELTASVLEEVILWAVRLKEENQ